MFFILLGNSLRMFMLNMNRANINRFKRILWFSFLYIVISHIPLVLTFLGFKFLLHDSEQGRNNSVQLAESETNIDRGYYNTLSTTLYKGFMPDNLSDDNSDSVERPFSQIDKSDNQNILKNENLLDTSFLNQNNNISLKPTGIGGIFKSILKLLIGYGDLEDNERIQDVRLQTEATRENTVFQNLYDSVNDINISERNSQNIPIRPTKEQHTTFFNDHLQENNPHVSVENKRKIDFMENLKPQTRKDSDFAESIKEQNGDTHEEKSADSLESYQQRKLNSDNSEEKDVPKSYQNASNPNETYTDNLNNANIIGDVARFNTLSTNTSTVSAKPVINSSVFYQLAPNDPYLLDLVQYIQPRSILDTKAEQVFDVKNLKYIPSLKNPCFFVKALDNETRVANSSLTLKCLPYFFIFGTEKCATSDLYYRLKLHHHVQVPELKEPQWFNNMRHVRSDIPHNGTLGGYNSMFKTAIDSVVKYCSQHLNPYSILKATVTTDPQSLCPPILLDATPRYFHNSHGISLDPLNANYSQPKVLVAHRVQHLLPQAKLIMMFRNPTDRVFSAYKYFARYNNKTTSVEEFHRYVLNGTRAWYSCINITSEINCAYGFKLPPVFRNSPVYDYKTANQIRIGMYYLFLIDTLPLFSKENMLMIEFEEYSRDASKYISEHVLDFVGLKQFDLMSKNKLHYFSSSKKVFNQDASELHDMWPGTRKILDDLYRPYNLKLAQLLNDNKFSWNS